MNDPIETLKEAAKLLGISCLAKKLDSLYFSNGRVCSHTNDFELLPPQFNRMDLQNLWDISLKAEDGTIINAHKCILIARLDYFNCMINRGWLEV